MDSKAHWEQIYASKPPDSVSWFQHHDDVALDMLDGLRLLPEASIIDIGAGASTFVDDVLGRGFRAVTALDISARALDVTLKRLGTRANGVQWIDCDLTQAALPAQTFMLWHDRAVFHFLTSPEQRLVYRRVLRHALKPGGFVIMATFAEDGPTQCSALPVCRYSADQLAAELGPDFALERHVKVSHHTPRDQVQAFTYCLFRDAR
ncbi:MAG: class I SAM-dependent methyltransferase [Gammaproteobacteria bacterium]|nr:class I SAM-dependent methyltransferase [Gammaproteobacteria bacterium]